MTFHSFAKRKSTSNVSYINKINETADNYKYVRQMLEKKSVINNMGRNLGTVVEIHPPRKELRPTSLTIITHDSLGINKHKSINFSEIDFIDEKYIYLDISEYGSDKYPKNYREVEDIHSYLNCPPFIREKDGDMSFAPNYFIL